MFVPNALKLFVSLTPHPPLGVSSWGTNDDSFVKKSLSVQHAIIDAPDGVNVYGDVLVGSKASFQQSNIEFSARDVVITVALNVTELTANCRSFALRDGAFLRAVRPAPSLPSDLNLTSLAFGGYNHISLGGLPDAVLSERQSELDSFAQHLDG